ncbi:MAG: alpha-D-ribose 1-methylphosphonate 5-triphosphate diphosphatase [Pseudomonadota bacterium]
MAGPFVISGPLRYGSPMDPATDITRIRDLAGFQIRPGIVDFHGDGFERHLAPRRGALRDLTEGLIALDAELAANGITTAFLAQFWSWEGGMRGPDFARRLAGALRDARPQLYTALHMQLRVETHMIEDFDAIAAFVEEAGIRIVIFNDHLPHGPLSEGKRPPRLEGQALKAGRAPEAHWRYLEGLHERSPDVPAAVAALSAKLRAMGVRIGSHDDASEATRTRYRGLGADIAEFPETIEALGAAHAARDPVILGAPNVVRGSSHKKGLSAGEAVRAGRCDVLVSDYHYPALRQAAWLLEAEGIDAWPLISEHPARLLGLPDGEGDHCVFDAAHRVVGTLTNGRWSYKAAPLYEALR